jgi:hypothetical protein
MKTIYRWIDQAGTIHISSDLVEAEKALKERKFILGALYHEADQ